MTKLNSDSGESATEHFPDGWGVNNSTGTLKDVLLGCPDNFRWCPVSAIARRTLQNLERLGVCFDIQVAMRQHREMVDIYEANAVRCHFLTPYEGLHYSVFARDNSAMTPWGPLVTSCQADARRRDYAVVAEFYQRAAIPIWKWVTAGYFEGGDFDIIEPGAVILGFGGERSEEAGALQVARWVEAEGWEALVVAFPGDFVHMDALVVMVAPKLAVVCVEAVEPYVVDWLKTRQIDILPVAYESCVRLGCNVVALGDDRVLSMASNTTLNEQLRARGFEVFAPDMSMFQYGGGGVHCLSQELRRVPQ